MTSAVLELIHCPGPIVPAHYGSRGRGRAESGHKLDRSVSAGDLIR